MVSVCLIVVTLVAAIVSIFKKDLNWPFYVIIPASAALAYVSVVMGNPVDGVIWWVCGVLWGHAWYNHCELKRLEKRLQEQVAAVRARV